MQLVFAWSKRNISQYWDLLCIKQDLSIVLHLSISLLSEVLRISLMFKIYKRQELLCRPIPANNGLNGC